MTLYEHVEDFQALQSLVQEAMTDEEGNVKELDASTREAIAAMADQWKDDFKAKAERVLKFRANVATEGAECLAQANIFEAEAARLKARAKMHTKKINGLNFLLMTVMDRLGLQKLETATFNMWIQRNAPAMEIRDESKIPAKYFIEVPASLQLEKDALRKDLIDGIPIEWVKPDGQQSDQELFIVPGAVIVQERGLRVK